MMDLSVKKQIDQILEAPTCYPEKERKSREQRLTELIYWYDRYNDVNIVYNLWGMDCTDAICIDEWLDRGNFRKERHGVNAFFYPNGSKFPMDYTVLMRDKRMFEGFVESVLGYGNKYSPSIAYIIEKHFLVKLYNENITFSSFIKQYENKKLVFKQVFGCSGETVKVVKIIAGEILYAGKTFAPENFLKELCSEKASNWIVQEFIVQHSQMNKLNETSVNTLRFVTYHIGDRVEMFPITMLRYGVPGALVDNANLAVGVTEMGIVMEDAFSLVEKKRFKCHAGGLQIPYFNEARDLVKMMHHHIPEIFTIGWDVCITPNGPHLIEGNDGWDVVLHQSFEGCRMRNFYNKMLLKRQKYYNK